MRSLSAASAAAVISLFLICPNVSLAGITRTTDVKLFRVELEIEPSQPIVGSNAAVLTVFDASSNQKVDDALIEAVPWMTMHGHGSSKKPAVKKAGNGQYRIENLYYTMEGDWDLIVTVQKGASKDTATFPVANVKRK
jgi:hypothetical protein